ncbi:hydantoinase/oxoprolinase family protein [Nocardia pseudovaccinii]|uniref:hydantoinase/oxoprolinase family protein n=1 Tax=Nocardia pseudovaccinii TaxID=189540 RepID=UPI0007A4AE47|nr:hydantoinase/oxoprolinase family protein [Nocardia pseudovaccinii]
MAFRITIDTGGTFTDVVVADGNGNIALGKALTNHDRVFVGIWEGLDAAAAVLGRTREEVLTGADLFVYATTRATNAIIEGETARTALLTTAGHPETLVMREGGRLDAFDFAVEYPEPYVPRRLTFEIDERIDAEGGIVRELDETGAVAIIEGLRQRHVEAVAVCLLWSTVNPAHELRLGELLEQHLPGIPITLSHQLNPVLREFRRASSAAIDASLKPLMQSHLTDLHMDLKAHGFAGELMAATSFGGVMHVSELAQRPIYSARSGPSMAPISGRTYASPHANGRDIIVCDTGGTSFDVSMVHDDKVVFTQETWLGGKYFGHLTGMSSVDARSIGAGGGSIAWVDSGGLLRVGPRSAGSNPGPAAYGLGGTEPTVTDAATVLGYLNPDNFHGGRLTLDVDAARSAVSELAEKIGLDPEKCAAAILTIANEQMVRAIHELTTVEGVDPRESFVVAGGGAGGLNCVAIMRELGCREVLVPRTAGGLSACGAQFSDIIFEYSATHPTSTRNFDFDGVNATLESLIGRAEAEASKLRSRGYDRTDLRLSVEARYAEQNWEIIVELPNLRFETEEDIKQLIDIFGTEHERLFMVRDNEAPVECLSWRLRAITATGAPLPPVQESSATSLVPEVRRIAYFDGVAHQSVVVRGAEALPGHEIAGPAIIEEPTTTIVLPPGATAHVTSTGNYLIEVGA